MDLIKLAEDLGLKETKEYKYRIRRKEGCRGYYIERFNKGNGFMCSMAISDTLLESLRDGFIKDFASLLHNDFNSIERKAIKAKSDIHDDIIFPETLPSKRIFGGLDIGDRISPIVKDGK